MSRGRTTNADQRRRASSREAAAGRPGRVLQLRLADLSAQDRQLVAQHDDLEVLRGATPEPEQHDTEHPPDEDVEKRGDHSTELPRRHPPTTNSGMLSPRTSSVARSGFGTSQEHGNLVMEHHDLDRQLHTRHGVKV